MVRNLLYRSIFCRRAFVTKSRFVIYSRNGRVINETDCPGHLEYVLGLYHHENPWHMTRAESEETLKGRKLAEAVVGTTNHHELKAIIKELDAASWHLDNEGLAKLSAANWLLANPQPQEN